MSLLAQVVQGSVLRLWESVISALPEVVGAVVVFALGLALALVLNSVIVKVAVMLKADEFVSKIELDKVFAKLGLTLKVGPLLGWVVKWFFIIVALIAATDVLGWGQLTDFLKRVVLYVPNVIIAVVILLAGTVLGGFVRNVVKSSVEAAKLSSASFLSGIAKWAILVFSFMAALVQLQIAPELIQVLFTGLVAMLALAGGLAFGLGGRDHAARALERLGKDLTSEK